MAYMPEKNPYMQEKTPYMQEKTAYMTEKMTYTAEKTPFYIGLKRVLLIVDFIPNIVCRCINYD